jgi:hypothetical protein
VHFGENVHMAKVTQRITGSVGERAARPGAGMMTSGRYGASGVGWLSLVLFWGLAIVGLVLAMWRSRNTGQSGPGARPGDGRRTQAELSEMIRAVRSGRH